MKGRFFGLLASLAAVLTDVGGASPAAGRRRRQAAQSAIDKAHQRAADRLRRQRRLELLTGMGWATPDEQSALVALRRRRGKVARRLQRSHAHGIGVTTRKIRAGKSRPQPAPLRLGDRIPRSARVALLREEGRPISGRQWKRLRKAARRQERAV